ncbi:hypothetical protein FRC04_011434 [Tulasnella sp. 424]|nr:hypothetical protein FRC04_011434 [Tulasnella sp. 424]
MQLACLASLTGECWKRPNLVAVLHDLESTARQCVAKVEAADKAAGVGVGIKESEQAATLDLTDRIVLDDEQILRKYSVLGTTRRGSLHHPTLGVVKVGVEKPPPGDKDEDHNTRLKNRRRDIELWGSLHHPNIMELLGTCVMSVDGITELCPVFRWIGLGTAKDLAMSGRPFDALKILKGAARALGYLHERGIIYGHMKATTILINRDGEALVRTFRTQRSLIPTDARRGVIYSRVAWAAPELLWNESMTTETDVYALGITIAEILSRKRPFRDRATVGAIVLAITNGERPSIEDVDEGMAPTYWRDVWSIACSCWAQNPSDRPTMKEVIHRLEALGDVSTPIIPDITSEIRKEPSLMRRGGFCEVYVGRHSSIGKVALRLPSVGNRGDDDQRRFWREMSILLKLSHPNINPLVGMFCDDEGYHMVSPWMEHGSVHSCIANDVPFDGLKVLLGVAEALDYMHQNGIVHGDLKLDNVLLSPSGEAKLIDFGLAKMLNFTSVTSTAMKGAGTVAWQAPEILNGEPRSAKTDVWAFGMIIVEYLTRKPPFWDAKDSGVIVTRIILKQARPSREDVNLKHAPTCWPELWDLAGKCWSQEPSDRLNMSDIVEYLIKVRDAPNDIPRQVGTIGNQNAPQGEPAASVPRT